MKRLWAPWRMGYIKGDVDEPGCLFCTRLSMQDDFTNLILHRGNASFVILNRFPYTNGHMMVVPCTHAASLEQLEPATRAELMELTNRALAVLSEAYGASAFNVGLNIGEAAGAGIVDHVHMHVIPRWPGDTNFMTTAAQTRVLPERLEDTYAALLATWERLYPDP